MLCRECSRRESCKSLCKKAEKYADQDYIYQRESTHPNYILEILSEKVSVYQLGEMASYFNEDSVNFPFLTKLQNKILKMFYFDGLSYREIAFRISGNRKGAYSCDAVSWQLRLAKRKFTQIIPNYKGGKCIRKIEN